MTKWRSKDRPQPLLTTYFGVVKFGHLGRSLQLESSFRTNSVWSIECKTNFGCSSYSHVYQISSAFNFTLALCSNGTHDMSQITRVLFFSKLKLLTDFLMLTFYICFSLFSFPAKMLQHLSFHLLMPLSS